MEQCNNNRMSCGEFENRRHCCHCCHCCCCRPNARWIFGLSVSRQSGMRCNGCCPCMQNRGCGCNHDRDDRNGGCSRDRDRDDRNGGCNRDRDRDRDCGCNHDRDRDC